MVAVIIQQGMHLNCICLHPCLSISFWEAFVLFVMHLFHAVFGILRFDINCHELKSGFPKLMCTSHREAVSRKPNACSSCCSINIVMLQNIMAPGAKYTRKLSPEVMNIRYKILKSPDLYRVALKIVKREDVLQTLTFLSYVRLAISEQFTAQYMGQDKHTLKLL